jgi:hypothetical protein
VDGTGLPLGGAKNAVMVVTLASFSVRVSDRRPEVDRGRENLHKYVSACGEADGCNTAQPGMWAVRRNRDLFTRKVLVYPMQGRIASVTA